MNAQQLAYSDDEQLLAAGFEDGRVTVFTVLDDDGSPDRIVGELDFHRSDVVFVGWTPERTLVSLSTEGDWCVSTSAGAIVRSGRRAVGHNSGAAALSPDGSALFLVDLVRRARGDRHRTSWLVRVDLRNGVEADVGATLTSRVFGAEARLEADVGVTLDSRVFGVTSDVALYEVRPGPTSGGGLQRADFTARSSAVSVFTPSDSPRWLSGAHGLAVDVARGLGIRPMYAPVAPIETEEGLVYPLRFALFDTRTLDTIRALDVGESVPAEEGGGLELRTAAVGSEAYRRALDWHLGVVNAIRFDPGGELAWFLFSDGSVRAVRLDGGKPGTLIDPGGVLGHESTPVLDDVFSPNPRRNSRTLAVSPNGSYLGVSNPTEFTRTEAARGASTPGRRIRLPMRAAHPRPVGSKFQRLLADGTLLTVADRSNGLWIVNLDSGQSTLVSTLSPHAGKIADVAISPDGAWLSLAMSRGHARLVHVPTGQVRELPIPPSTSDTVFVADRSVAFVHGSGAVAVARLDDNRICAARRDLCGGEYLAGDWSFEELWEEDGRVPLFGPGGWVESSTHYELQGTCRFVLAHFNGTLTTYSCEESAVVLHGWLEDAAYFDHEREDASYSDPEREFDHEPGYVFTSIVAVGDYLAVPSGNSTIHVLAGEDGRVLTSYVAEGDIRYPFAWGDRLAWYDDRASAVFVVTPLGDAPPEVVYRFRPAYLRPRDINAKGDRVAFLEHNGSVCVVELPTGRERHVTMYTHVDGLCSPSVRDWCRPDASPWGLSS